ncbi:MAG: hypothetical protein MI976_00455 [Pseudomonadales bacterium]|nr:hypothetical protein [Pseudomonadales bacterium]
MGVSLIKQRIKTAALSCLFVFLTGCTGEEKIDEPRVATGSSDTTGLWRVTESQHGDTFYSTVLIEEKNGGLELTDCSRSFVKEALSREGNSFSGYNEDLAPLNIINNDRMQWFYDGQIRQFEKMDVNPEFDMGTFSFTEYYLININANRVVCVQFSETDNGETLILTTEVLGSPFLITIRMKDGIEEGSFDIDPYGQERAMVTFSGGYWSATTLKAYGDVGRGTLTINRRGNVLIEGEIDGVLANGITPITVSFDVETAVN